MLSLFYLIFFNGVVKVEINTVKPTFIAEEMDRYVYEHYCYLRPYIWVPHGTLLRSAPSPNAISGPVQPKPEVFGQVIAIGLEHRLWSSLEFQPDLGFFSLFSSKRGRWR